MLDCANRPQGSGLATKTSGQKGAGWDTSRSGDFRVGHNRSFRFRRNTLCHGSSATSNLGAATAFGLRLREVSISRGPWIMLPLRVEGVTYYSWAANIYDRLTSSR